MNRRRFVRTAAGTTVVPVAMLAGCIDEQSARDYIDDAAALIEKNNDTFSEFDLGVEEGQDEPTFDGAIVRGRVDDAFELLDVAESLEPTDDEREMIESLRQLGEAQLVLADFVEQIIELVSTFQTVREYIDSNELDEALDGFLDLDDQISDTKSTLEEVEAAYEAIDREPFEEEDREGLAEGDRQLALMSDRLAGFALLVEGFIPFLRGNIAWQEGADLYVEQEDEAAIDRYNEALDELTQANEIFRGGQESPPTDEIDYERFACITDNLLDVVDHLKASAQARLDGDEEEAEQRWTQGTDLLESGDC